MKKALYIHLLLFATLVTTAQTIDRTKAPKPGPAPVINIADPVSFVLPNGLKVFVVTNSKLPQVSATLTINRDPLMEGEKAGMLGMAGSLMRRGTNTMSKAVLDESVDFLGANLFTGATSVSGSSLKQNFPKLMKIMADVALRPSFSKEELEKVRTQTLSGLAQAQDDPNSIASNVSSVLLYGKSHPYGEIETMETVKNVSVADIKKYHDVYWKPNIAYLIFVGDITPAEAQKIATEQFGKWQKGVIPAKAYPAVKPPARTYIAIIDRPSSVQSVIRIASPVQLKPGSPKAIPTSLMSSILGGGFSSRLVQNLREKYGFTYGASGGVSPDKLVGRFGASASVRNEKTDSAVGQFIHEFNRMRNEAASDTEVTSLKNYMSGEFARSLENPGTVASFALSTAVYGLPKDYYRKYLTSLNAVTAEQVQQVAREFIPVNNLVITIVGNAKEIAKELDKYGPVKYFDIYGNPKEAPVEKKVSGSITPESILQKAVEAYGGAAAIAALKDVSFTGNVELMGQSMVYEQKHIFPDGYSTAIKMGGMELMKTTKNGDDYKIMMQGADQPLDADAKSELRAKAALFEESYYLSNKDYKFEMKGIEQVDGKDAYHIGVTTPGGTTFSAYYDVATGLKIQDVREQEMGPMGKVNVTNRVLEYKEYNGVKLPVKMLIDLGMMKQNIVISEVKVNQGLTSKDL